MAKLRNKEEYLRKFVGEILHENNLQLAINYWRNRASHGISPYSTQTMAKVVTSAPIDIPEYYKENKKSLENMKVKGIGKFLKADLERILKKPGYFALVP